MLPISAIWLLAAAATHAFISKLEVCLLIHSANPQSRPVGKIVFAHVVLP